ncbi:hypothetical protein JNJ66_02735 [Candidatus Saccharibacteria bacterium]|nr:hypothetical protein [Candidatus Saccharibacteria bacterium]
MSDPDTPATDAPAGTVPAEDARELWPDALSAAGAALLVAGDSAARAAAGYLLLRQLYDRRTRSIERRLHWLDKLIRLLNRAEQRRSTAVSGAEESARAATVSIADMIGTAEEQGANVTAVRGQMDVITRLQGYGDQPEQWTLVRSGLLAVLRQLQAQWQPLLADSKDEADRLLRLSGHLYTLRDALRRQARGDREGA